MVRENTEAVRKRIVIFTQQVVSFCHVDSSIDTTSDPPNVEKFRDTERKSILVSSLNLIRIESLRCSIRN